MLLLLGAVMVFGQLIGRFLAAADTVRISAHDLIAVTDPRVD